MLLRRISKHVKDPNWFAIALDFVIVVVGILIAFQITNWNERSKASEREKIILVQLYAEFSGTHDGMKKAKLESEEGRKS